MIPFSNSVLSEFEKYVQNKGKYIPEPFHTTQHIIEALSDPAIAQKMAEDEAFNTFMETKVYYVQEELKPAEFKKLIEKYYTQETRLIYNALVDMYLCFASISNVLNNKEVEGFKNALTSNTKTGIRINELLNKRQQSVQFCIEQKVYRPAA